MATEDFYQANLGAVNARGQAQLIQNQLAKQQGRMAQEQWDWQKALYQQQLANQQANAGALSGLIGQYNQAYSEAKNANEQRYQQLLGIADQTTGQRAADITSQYGQQGANLMQQLARTGLSNTTVAPTLQQGVQREQQSALNRLADEMQQTKLGIIERRTDQYPDVNSLVSLIAGLGNSTGGNVNLQSLGSLMLG